MDVTFNTNKIRFVILDELIRQNHIKIKNNKVNLFINLEPILFRLTNKRIDEYLRIQNESKIFQIISNLFNLVAHYRLYFASRHVDSRIFLYIQYPFDSEFNNIKYNIEYRCVYKFKYVDNINNYIICDNMVSALKLTSILLEYINGCYLITANNVENSVIPMILDNNDRTNFILTKDIYDMQYLASDYNILYARQDESMLLTKENFKPSFEKLYDVDMEGISVKHLPFILSISGNSHRNIYGIKGIGLKRACNMMRVALKNNIITENTDNINILLRVVKDSYKRDIERNYYCTDIGTQFNDLTTKDMYTIKEQIIDKFDNDALKDMQYRYFQDYPLMLDAITLLPREQRYVKF